MDEESILNLYRKYIAAFEDKNYDFISGICRTPFFTSSPASSMVFQDKIQLVEAFSSLRESLDVQEYVKSRINKLDFTEITETTATLFVDFDRINPNGDDFHHGQALYLFQGSRETIQIIGIIVLDDHTISPWTEN